MGELLENYGTTMGQPPFSVVVSWPDKRHQYITDCWKDEKKNEKRSFTDRKK
jgi:hypothetical protein